MFFFCFCPISSEVFEGGSAWEGGGGGGGGRKVPAAHNITLKLLTLKLAGFFAKHILARGGGREVPENFEMANN